MGFYQVIRSIGFSIGSALTASILAAHLDVGTGRPAEHGFVVALWVGAAVCLLAAIVCAALSPPGPPSALGASLERRLRDEAEVASAGLIEID
jgi:hypothetical protein